MDPKDQIRKHLELERMFGVDFIPGRPSAPRTPHSPDPSGGEWGTFRTEVLACTKCKLSSTRTQVVFGVGPVTAPLMFVGEGPGEQEDLQGEPFVGRAGQLLTKTLQKFGVSRSQVYITNIVKCRPPNNRTPQPDEVAACMPHLLEQIRRIAPKVLCTLGGPATHGLLNTTIGITKLRGRYHEHNGLRIFPTFHPAYVLRNMGEIKTLEADLSRACRDAGLLS